MVVEGIDGAGKSTLARGIRDALVSRPVLPWREVVLTAEPTNGPHGRALREAFSGERRLSLEEEYRLFILDRREHVERLLRPKLEEGALVICDRYYLSTMAYQGARGMDMEVIRRENEAFAPRPHLVLLVELPVEEALARITRSRGDRPNLMEERGYLQLVERNFRSMDAPYMIRLDGLRPQEELIRKGVELILKGCPSP